MTVALSRFAPRGFVDRVILGQIRKGMNSQGAQAVPGPVGEFASRIG